jgi:outer membrane protein
MSCSLSHSPHVLACLLLSAFAAPLAAHAQIVTPAPDPNQLAERTSDERRNDREVEIGLFSAYTPVFLGSKDYQLVAGPNIQVRYGRAFFSMQDGLGYDVIRSGGWRVGPAIGFRQGRRENGNSIFKIAGDRSNALLGLGNVEATAEAGGYVGYQSGKFAAKIDVRQALSGGQGLIATLGLHYLAAIPLSSASDAQPIRIALGPRLMVVDDKYNQTYFGVTAIQSARSGLRQYNANGGLLSAGVGLSAHVPLTERISGAVLMGYDRLTGDAARAPLVADRGSRSQATVGLGLTYKFGL